MNLKKRLAFFAPLIHFTQNNMDLSSDVLAMTRIREMAEKVKVDLTNSSNADFNIPFIAVNPATGEPLHISIKMARSRVNGLADAVIKKTMNVVVEGLKAANMEKTQITDIVFGGGNLSYFFLFVYCSGMTRMPKIMSTVEEFFGKKASKAINPEEAVSFGAIVYTKVIEDYKEAVKRGLEKAKMPVSIGIEMQGGSYYKVIPRGTPLPVTKLVQMIPATEDQHSVFIKIFQGERVNPYANTFLRQILLVGLVSEIQLILIE
jgi:molecular chaperone DnaK